MQELYSSMSWDVILDEEVEAWFLDLANTDRASADQVAAAIDLLSEEGPPWADRSSTRSTARNTTT
jgi:hypothetical protein